MGKRVYIKKLIEYNTKYYKGHARKNKKSIHKKLKKCNFCFLKLLHELGKCSTIKMWKIIAKKSKRIEKKEKKRIKRKRRKGKNKKE